MGRDIRSSTESGPITRSGGSARDRDTLSKKSPSTTPNRKSDRLSKRTPPSLAVRTKPPKSMLPTPPTLRRSERTKNLSPSLPQPQHQNSVSKSLTFKVTELEHHVPPSSQVKTKTLDARIYRSIFKKPKTDCNRGSKKMETSTPQGGDIGRDKVDECFKGTPSDCKEACKDVRSTPQGGDDGGGEVDECFKGSPSDCKEASKDGRSTPQGGDSGGVKVDECFKGSPSDCKEVSKDGIQPSEDDKAKEMKAESRLSALIKELLENKFTLGSSLPSNVTTDETRMGTGRVQSGCREEETLQMLESQRSILNEDLPRNYGRHDNRENLISSKRKGTLVDTCSDFSATLADDNNYNLIADAGSSRLCGDAVGTSGSCFKRIRRISLSDVPRDHRKLINNVDQPSSKFECEKFSTKNTGKSGAPVETPQGNNDETEKIREEQRSLHILLKPEIANLCEILHLPEKVKCMVDNYLEYVMNNRRICTEPVSILQAFQLSLCWTAAALLKYELNPKASLMLAKQHLNFNCKMKEVNEISLILLNLKEDFLQCTGKTNIFGSPVGSESSNKVYSYTGMAPEFELTNKDNSKNIKEWELLLMQQEEEKKKLKVNIDKEQADFERRYKIELAAALSRYPNNVMRREKLKVFNSEYGKRIRELKRRHEICLKEHEAKQLEARQKFQEFMAPDELLNPVASAECGAGVDYLKTCDQAQPHSGPKNLAPVSDHIAEVKSFDNIVNATTCTGTGVGSSEDTNPPVAVSCSNQVELQTPLAKHPIATEMDIMASEDGPGSRNKCLYVAENDSLGKIIAKDSKSREQCLEGATSTSDEGEGYENFNHNSYGQDTVTLVQHSSNGEICDGETSDVPSGESALAESKSTSSNDDQDEVPSSRQGKLDGTILSKPVCGFSEKVNASGFSDDMNTALLNSHSPEEHIARVTTTCMPNCEDAAQIHKADDCNGSNNADTPSPLLSDERITSLNSKSSQPHVNSANAMCMPNCENSVQIYEAADGNGSNSSNNVVTPNSPLTGERNADGAIVSVIDREVHVGMRGTASLTHCPDNGTIMNLPLSMEQISCGSVDVSILDREQSRPCGTASPINGPNANDVTLLSQPSSEKQHPDGVPSSISAGLIPTEVPETSHEGVTVSVLDREVPVCMPDTISCTDYPQNVTPSRASNPSNCPATVSLLNQPSLQHQIPDCVSLSILNGQNPVIMPETSHEVTENQLKDGVVVDISNASDQQGEHRTVTENTLSQEAAVSGPVDLMKPLEQVQPLSSVESPPDQDMAREKWNPLEASQSNHVVEPPEQVQQLPSAEFLSSDLDSSNLPLATGIEYLLTNEDGLSSPVPDASIEVPNQAVEQAASNLDLDSPVADGVRTESSEIRNLFVPSEINNHLRQTATQSASTIVPPLCDDPLRNELERISELTEQVMKNHEDMKLQLKSDFEKELEELHRKYEIKLREIDIEFQQTRKNLDTRRNTVLANKILAEAFRYKCLDLKASGASGMQQDASITQQLVQLLRQQNATWRPLVVSSSNGPPAAGLQSSYTSTSFQNMVPSMQAPYNTSGIFSSLPARLPNIINPISSPSNSSNLQFGGEIRAPAPHLQPYRPITSVSPSSLCTVTNGMTSQPAPCNIPVTMPSFSHWLPQVAPSTYQSDPRRGHRPVTVGVLPSSNLPALGLHMDPNSQSGINLPNVQSHMSDLASLNHSRDPNGQSGINLPNVQSRMSDLASLIQSRFGTSGHGSMPADPAHQATCPDVVCLSDDDD